MFAVCSKHLLGYVYIWSRECPDTDDFPGVSRFTIQTQMQLEKLFDTRLYKFFQARLEKRFEIHLARLEQFLKTRLQKLSRCVSRRFGDAHTHAFDKLES